MVSRLLNYKITQLALISLIVVGMLICVFTPNYYLFKMGTRFAIQIMLGYLLLGILFLLIKQPRLMFTSFACCAGLCLFLKYSSNTDFRLPVRTSDAVIQAAHFNVSGSDEDYESTMQSILQADADIVSIQEVTPDWAVVLKESLQSVYPYSKTVVRFDPFGLAIYSKYPFDYVDTFHFEDIPNIVGCIKPTGMHQPVYFISSHTTPPLYSLAYERLRKHLHRIAQFANDLAAPVITLGDYNAPPWWTEIQQMKEYASLNDSRRSVQSGWMHVFQNPVDYIFYSNHFNCVDFETISSHSSSHLGIKGVYEVKPVPAHVEASIQ